MTIGEQHNQNGSKPKEHNPTEPSGDSAQTLWHGRFASGPSEALMTYTESLPFDQQLVYVDIQGSRAHVAGLEKSKIISTQDAQAILAALDQVQAEFESDQFNFKPSDEDIHTAVERRVTEIAGDAGARLHTARSRNDQVATDLRLFVKAQMLEVAALTLKLAETLSQRASADTSSYLPGYTHLQRAQPVTLAHHLMAHSWAFCRDVTRLLAVRTQADVSPLGAGALAGSTLDIEPAFVAEKLGFSRLFTNSLDAVSDRDFVADALHSLAMVGLHLSRIGEEFVLFSSEEFGFITVDDGYATGSSMMPQKKNPDIAELSRGKAGRLIGNLTGFLATLKGLPLAYNRDLQEDKEPLFDSLTQVRAGLIAVNGMIETVTFNTEVMAEAADCSAAGATDLADWLVRRGMPFRQAHSVVAEVVRESIEKDLPLQEVVAASSSFGEAAAAMLAPGVGVTLRTSPGAPAPVRVREQLAQLNEQISELKSTLD